MKRTAIESALLVLLKAWTLAPEMRTIDLADSRHITLNPEGDGLTIHAAAPFVLLVPGGQKLTDPDVYGYAYNQNYECELWVGNANYSGPAECRQGTDDKPGLNDMLDGLKTLLAGKEILTGARCFLSAEDPLIQIGGMIVYSLALNIHGEYNALEE